MNVTARRILRTIVDEGASVSILSSTAWQALGSPQLVPATDQMLDFNQIPTAPLGTLPYFPITLGGKTVCIDVMVVQGPLDFNMLRGCSDSLNMNDTYFSFIGLIKLNIERPSFGNESLLSQVRKTYEFGLVSRRAITSVCHPL